MSRAVTIGLIAWTLIASAVAISYGGDPEHECGKGPVTIKIMVPSTRDCNHCVEQPPTRLGSLYMGGASYCTAMACMETVEHRWTTWPECGGTRIEGKP